MIFPILIILERAQHNSHEDELYNDIIPAHYTTMARPGLNSSVPLEINVEFTLREIVNVDMKNQVITVCLKIRQKWNNSNLMWNHSQYGGIRDILLSTEQAWSPDIVLYDNAEGNFQMDFSTKMKVRHDGTVTWAPTMIYKSFCDIDISRFPFDEQKCNLKFSTWTYDGITVVLSPTVKRGGKPEVDLSEFVESDEWAIVNTDIQKNIRYYHCCIEPYIDITFHLDIRRKPLFYIIEFIIPCFLIALSTVAVFLLPPNSGERITYCISILIIVTLFILFLNEYIPPTSNTISLGSAYMTFMLFLVTMSIICTVAVLNVNGRICGNHEFNESMRKLFFHYIPSFFFLERSPTRQKSGKDNNLQLFETSCDENKFFEPVMKIASLMNDQINNENVDSQWTDAAKILDKLFLILFTLTLCIGTILIFFA